MIEKPHGLKCLRSHELCRKTFSRYLVDEFGFNEAAWGDAMCAKTRAVVSTVGSYAFYGEPLVRVCVATGSDYCDLTGEIPWLPPRA